MSTEPRIRPSTRLTRASAGDLAHARARHAGGADTLLTIAQVCASLDVSRRTFYEWRAKNKAPRCIALPNGSLRIRRSEYQRWLASREAC